jgi:septal ring factor EnvC (AmiA/AmiB activator)
MAPQRSIDRSEDQINSNGWTRYQNLVLSELERHDEQLNQLNKEIVETKMELTRLRSDIKSLEAQVGKLVDAIKISEKENSNLHLNISKLNWKAGGLITVLSSVVSIAGTALIKMLLHL